MFISQLISCYYINSNPDGKSYQRFTRSENRNGYCIAVSFPSCFGNDLFNIRFGTCSAYYDNLHLFELKFLYLGYAG